MTEGGTTIFQEFVKRVLTEYDIPLPAMDSFTYERLTFDVIPKGQMALLCKSLTITVEFNLSGFFRDTHPRNFAVFDSVKLSYNHWNAGSNGHAEDFNVYVTKYPGEPAKYEGHSRRKLLTFLA